MSEPTDNREIKENIRKAYNDIADVYLKWTKSTHEVRIAYLEKLLKSLTPAEGDRQRSILELGCGACEPCTQLLAARGDLSITANDISESQIALARTKLPDSVNLIQGDMMALNFNEGQFDAVVGMYSIIHLPRTEQTEILHRIWGWLRPGGRFLANFSESEFAGSVHQTWLGGSEGSMYWSGWGRDEIKRILVDIGFEIEIDEVVVDSEEENGVSRDVPFHWILAKK